MPVCGAVNYSVSAEYSSGAQASHVTGSMPVDEYIINFDYSSWTSGTLQQSITVTVDAWHSTYTSVKATK